MLSPRKLLENARNRISKRENWTTAAIAESKHRATPLGACDPSATCWCALGALAAEAGVNEVDTSDVITKLLQFPEGREAVTLLGKQAAEQIARDFETFVKNCEEGAARYESQGDRQSAEYYRQNAEHYRLCAAETRAVTDPDELSRSIYRLNDRHGHEDVLEAFDRTITTMKGE